MKYHNRKTVVDGITFDSQKEANRYCELRILQRAGQIRKLVLQPVFELQRAFVDDDGHKHRAITYIPDFQYEDKKHKWELVVEDVKGMKTEVYKIKKKLFIFRYPYHFIET